MLRLFVLAGVVGCDKDGGDPGEKENLGTPTITITSPADGAGSYSGDATLEWAVENFTLDESAIGFEDVPRHGHIHVYVDGEKMVETAEPQASLTALPAGQHTVEVYLADNDHDELDATDSISLPIAHASVLVVSPLDGTTLTTSSTPLTVAISGFEMADSLTGRDAFGEGHYTVSIDGQVYDRGLDPALAVATGMAEGEHTITVELVTTSGAPLDPPVKSDARVTVLPGATGVYFDRTAFSAPYDSATVPITLSATNITLVPSDGTVLPVAGEGHYHIFVDGVWLEASADATRVLQNLAGGTHVFEARLASNDSIEMGILDRMWVDIPLDRPDVRVTYPGTGWRMSDAFNVLFDVENFTLDEAAMSGANEDGHGHVGAFVDGLPAGETANGVFPLSGLTAGDHVLRMQLLNNDATPVDPAVYAEFPFVVQSATTP